MPCLAEGQEAAVWRSAGLLSNARFATASSPSEYCPFRNAAILLGQTGLAHGTPSLAPEQRRAAHKRLCRAIARSTLIEVSASACARKTRVARAAGRSRQRLSHPPMRGVADKSISIA